jgi:hypothetical protein
MTAWGCERAGGGDIKSSVLLQIETDRQTDRQTDRLPSRLIDSLPTVPCILYLTPLPVDIISDNNYRYLPR